MQSPPSDRGLDGADYSQYISLNYKMAVASNCLTLCQQLRTKALAKLHKCQADANMDCLELLVRFAVAKMRLWLLLCCCLQNVENPL